MKYNMILNWECCLTVPLSWLQRMTLLYEFFKETSMLSASAKGDAHRHPETPFQGSLLGLCSSDFAARDAASVIFRNSQNVHLAFSGSKVPFDGLVRWLNR